MLLLTPLPNILLTIYSPPTHHPISPPGEHEYVHQHNITLSYQIRKKKRKKEKKFLNYKIFFSSII